MFVIKEWILRLYTFMGSRGATLRLYIQVHHRKITHLQNTKALEHVSATAHSHLRGYLKTHMCVFVWVL